MDMPKSVGFIPDGNRRFAKRLMENPSKGHEWGVDKIKNVFEWCKENNVKHMTFYSLSLENMQKRPKEELDFLFALARREIEAIIEDSDNFVHKNRIKLHFFGNLHMLPRDLQLKISEATAMTKSYTSYRINFALAYGSRQEIVDAAKRIGFLVATNQLRPEDVDEVVLRQNFQTNGSPDPDLIIRTGGEKRLSNFLLYQSAYSELAFTDSFWPEFSKEEFVSMLNDYASRERRFGK